MSNTIGDNIKKRRLELDMSVIELAEKTGKNRATIYRYENNEVEEFSVNAIEELAKALKVTPDYFFAFNSEDKQNFYKAKSIYKEKDKGVFEKIYKEKRKNKVAVLGTVQAGIPVEAIEDILGYEELSPSMVETGAEYFALRVKGDSMLPRFQEGDIVIVRKQSDVNHDDIAIVLVGNEEATIKRVVKSEVGIMLVANNPSYEPKFYSNKDIIEKPVTILGKVVELRAKF